MTTPPQQRALQGAALKQARERRGWSQTDLETELRAVAKRMGKLRDLPYSTKTLIAYISYFENGKRSVSEKLKPIFRETLRASDEELGFATSSTLVVAPPVLPSSPKLPADAGPAVISNLRAVLLAHISMESLVGPRYVIPAVLGQLPLIEHLYTVMRGPDRDEVLRFASRFVEFCGWLYQDSGDFYCAMQLTNKALDYAAELNNPHVTSYVLMRKSNIASDNDEPGTALGLANAALANHEQLTPRLRAVALRQQANALAALGERDAFREAADAAREAAFEGMVQQEPDLAHYCTPAYVEMETGGALLVLNKPDEALPIFQAARTDWADESQKRDQVLCAARTAVAFAAVGERDEACKLTEEVVQQSEGISSARVARPLADLRRHLTTWSGDSHVGDLRHRLDLLLRSSESSVSRPRGLA